MVRTCAECRLLWDDEEPDAITPIKVMGLGGVFCSMPCASKAKPRTSLEQLASGEAMLDDELELLRIIMRKFKHLDGDARDRVLAYAGDVHKSMTRREQRGADS